MKVIFILATYATLYLIFFKFRATYDSNNDTFRAELLVIPVAGLSVLVNHEFTILEVCLSCVNCIVLLHLVYIMHFYYFNIIILDFVDFFYLFGVYGNNASAIHDIKDW